MAKVIDCGSAGPVCRAKLTGETDEEVLEKALLHAREDHGVELAGSSTFLNYLRSAIRDDSAGDEES